MTNPFRQTNAPRPAPQGLTKQQGELIARTMAEFVAPLQRELTAMRKQLDAQQTAIDSTINDVTRAYLGDFPEGDDDATHRVKKAMAEAPEQYK
ncbi:hypothetical protein [Shimia thalassica]|uniref:hypothetical protein n=1 Tax=Shimia thalassica TaxID=1715693 RepID=UPI0026E4513D|nr:hypothetical protein [Shimia thalassica]MDO6483564.1 hypothetical protein [Shimia thalassica]